jgi:hypothetical protein
MKDVGRTENVDRPKQQVMLFSPLPGLCVEHQADEAADLPERWVWMVLMLSLVGPFLLWAFSKSQ